MGGRSIKFCPPKSANSYSWVLVPSYREENLSPSFKKKKKLTRLLLTDIKCLLCWKKNSGATAAGGSETVFKKIEID